MSADFVIETLVVATVLKVTVSVGPPPRTAVHGLVVPEQVEGLSAPWPLQPPKVEPTLGLARKVTVAPLSEVVMFGEHVLETV